MQLFGSLTSPYVRHCRIALMQSKQTFDLISTNQDQSQELTPTQRVPFLHNKNLRLSDSASIIRFAREQAKASFLPTVEELDQFCLINTVLDSAANIFYLEKFGLKADDNGYIVRQNNRIQATLKVLEGNLDNQYQPNNDCHIRLACLVDWMIFRHRIDIVHFPKLNNFVQQAMENYEFAQTAPTE